jgi:radical SAM superfamily enzyme YgiQ (UPF0313 family)
MGGAGFDPSRMGVCLVTALTVADFVDPTLIAETHTKTGAQLGVLTLAALLRSEGFQPHVVHLDDLFLAFSRRREACPTGASEDSELFFPFVAEHLGSLSFDVFGFSSICSSYPLTLRLAREAKRLYPNAQIILGGPQASVVDVSTLRAFPCIDVIVRGEADETLPTLLRRLAEGTDWHGIPGITFRLGDEVVRNRNAPVVSDLDHLPLPAFDLDPSLKGRGGIHLEIGRGCPFACTFCSTNDFFRRNFRLKSPEKTMEEIRRIRMEYGIDYFSLVHDMYTIDRKKVVAFCETARGSDQPFTWGCSARTDCVDDELIGLMAEAGCRGIFFGIETGSARLQHVINKKLDLVEAVKRIGCADRHGVQTTVALIVGFPEETRDDLRDTVHFFVDSLRFDHAEPQCSLLAPLAATPIYEAHKDHLVFDHIFSDMSHQSWRQDPMEVALIRAYPDIFPNFYAVPTRWLDRSYVKEVVDFVTYLATWFRWLPVALLQDSGDLLGVFDRWRRWRTERGPCQSDEDIGWTPYYSHRRFRNEFLEFVRTCYLDEMATAHAAIRALTHAEGELMASPGHLVARSIEDGDRLDLTWMPYRPANVFLVDLEVDYKSLIETLRTKADLSRVPVRKSTIVLTPTGCPEIQVWQLAPASLSLLRLCDGKRTVGEIAAAFARLDPGIRGVAPETVCRFGLMQLRKDGFIAISSWPLETAECADANSVAPAAARYSLPPRTTNTQQPWPVQWEGRSRVSVADRTDTV